MNSKSMEQARKLFEQIPPLPDDVLRMLAKCFAFFAMELMQLDARQRTDGNDDGPKDTTPSGEALLKDAPKWIRDAYAAVSDTQTNGTPDQNVRARVARNKLQIARENSGLSQAEIARQLGKSATAVSRVFRHPEKCRIQTLQQIAEVLKVDLADIV